jgi:hypothetical protein
MLALAGGSLFAGGRVSIGVSIGGGPGFYGPGYYAPGYYYMPPPPAPIYTYIPPSPGPGFAWVGGYWAPAGGRYQWRPGSWMRPPKGYKRWVAPRYYNNRYYLGYWR